MKTTTLILIVVAAIATLSFSFVKANKQAASVQTESAKSVSIPAGGFSMEDAL
jgi:hypothetical protein